MESDRPSHVLAIRPALVAVRQLGLVNGTSAWLPANASAMPLTKKGTKSLNKTRGAYFGWFGRHSRGLTNSREASIRRSDFGVVASLEVEEDWGSVSSEEYDREEFGEVFGKPEEAFSINLRPS